MAIKGQPLPLGYTAWNVRADEPEVGDAANHTLRIVRDGVMATPTNSPTEISATYLKGAYQILLTAAEMTCDSLDFGGESSTDYVIILPRHVTTQPSAVGTGAVAWDITCQTELGAAIPGVKVWWTTDLAGNNVVYGAGYSNASGVASFSVAVGTYYVWKELAGFNFTNPTQVTVT